MLIANNDDILFDDLAMIGSTHLSGSSSNTTIMYGDCGNRFETETTEPSISNGSSSSYQAINDCDNRLLS